MKKLLVLTIAVAILSTGCAKQYVDNYLRDGSIKDRISNVSDEKYLRTLGIGACDKGIDNETQRRAMSKNSAVSNARYELLAVIKGLKIEGGIEVGKAIEKDDSIRERAERIIRGAEIIDYQWTRDDGCLVTIQLERSKIKDIIKEDKYENPKQQLNYRSPEKEDVKLGALLTGIIIPTGGLWYNGYCEEGLWSFLIFTGCVGGAYLIETSPEYEGRRNLKWVGVGGAVLVWAYTAIQGHKIENLPSNLRVDLAPSRDGMQLACSLKF